MLIRRLVPLAVLLCLLTAAGLSFAPAQDKKDKDKDKDKGKDVAGLVFEVYKDKSGEFRFRLKQGDTNLAISPRGHDKDEVQKVIATIMKEAGKAKIVEVKDGKEK